MQALLIKPRAVSAQLRAQWPGLWWERSLVTPTAPTVAEDGEAMVLLWAQEPEREQCSPTRRRKSRLPYACVCEIAAML